MYEEGIEIPFFLRNRWAPSRHSGDSSLSPNDPIEQTDCQYSPKLFLPKIICKNYQRHCPRHLSCHVNVFKLTSFNIWIVCHRKHFRDTLVHVHDVLELSIYKAVVEILREGKARMCRESQNIANTIFERTKYFNWSVKINCNILKASVCRLYETIRKMLLQNTNNQ